MSAAPRARSGPQPGLRSGPGLKVCGLTTAEGVDAAVAAGADWLGFVFHPRSPRHLGLAQAAALAARVPPHVSRVALTVDPDDAALGAILDAVPIEVVQLHGHEPPERVAEVARRVPVMKALGVAGPDDLDAIPAYAAVASLLLIDAKPAPGGLPGGNGAAFDWQLLEGRRWSVPWLLAGGLTSANVAPAVRITGAPGVDVSSGVESAPGIKDASLIEAFAAALREVQAEPVEAGQGELAAPR